MIKSQLHINCDLGEGAPNEAQIIPYVQSCNIACGGHYGTLDTVTKTLEASKSYGLSVGAHPSYPDSENFGRKSMEMNRQEFIASIQGQMNLFVEGLEKVSLHDFHIKAHGALYNDLCVNPTLCEWFLEAVSAYTYSELYCPWNSELYTLAKKENIDVKTEAFIDRNYTDEGRLVSRAQPHAEKESLESVWKQLESIVDTNTLESITGKRIELQAETFCLHGDHPLALERIQYIHQQLE